MSTKIVPVPIGSSCSGVMYNLGNYNYTCVSHEWYNQHLEDTKYEGVIAVSFFVLMIVAIVVAINWLLKD